MLLREIMQRKVTTVSTDCTIREAAQKMKDYRVGYLLITNSGELKGCITDRDLATWLAEGRDPDEARVSSIMQRNVITANPDTDVFNASKIMARRRVRRLPVMEDGSLVGLVSSSDIASVIEEEVDNFLHVEEAYQH